MNSVAAIVVTYNVEETFINRIKKLSGKVDEIIVVDNGSKEATINILKTLEEKITIIYLNENEGIAYALNKGIEYAISKGYNWILTLDHDSIVTDNMIGNMLSCYEDLDEDLKKIVAMLTPIHIEEKNYYNENSICKTEEKYTEVLTEITSGALVKSDIYKSQGMYDEKLFIDLVDHDYCLHLNDKGFKILQVNDAILIHNLGESISKNILGVKLTPTNHSAIRRYYMTRNRLYIWKKYKERFPKWVLIDKRRFISEIVKIILFEENKFEKLRFIKKGISDYKKGKLGKINE